MAFDSSVSVPLDELATHAARVRVAVIGGGVAGLIAASECVKIGMRVTVFEAHEGLGGTVRTVELDGVDVDTGADRFTGGVRATVSAFGLDDRVRPQTEHTRWAAASAETDAAPLPVEALCGIPENIWSPEVHALLGTAGTWRAYLDRLRPPLTIGHEKRLSALVRTRMGRKALQRLVTPISVGTFGIGPEDVDVDAAAPGLNAALTRTGSLSGAVAVVREQQSAQPEPATLEGGMGTFVEALRSRLDDLGADIHVGTRVTEIEPAGSERGDGWIVRTEADEFDATDDASDHGLFDAVIVAVPERDARTLLAPVVADLDSATGSSAQVETVTLVVDSSALDDHPRGAEVVAAPTSSGAVRVVHATAAFGHLAEAAGPTRHILRVAFGTATTPPATAGQDDADAIERARAEASDLLGVELPADAVRAARRERFAYAPPASHRGHRERAQAVRAAVEGVPHLAVTGAWVAGSGLASVVADAVAAADRLRRRVLFRQDASS